MDGFMTLDSKLIRFEVEQHTNYHCIVCKAEFLSREARNEHLETHFIHRNCTNCHKGVIVIGDLEFELHRPSHCSEINIKLCKSTLNSFDTLNVESVSSNDLKDDTPKVSCDEELVDEAEHTHYQPQQIDDEDINLRQTVNTAKRKGRRSNQTKAKNSIENKLENIETESNQSYDDYAVTKSESEIDVDAFKQMEPEKKTQKRRIYAKLPKTIPCSKCDMLFGSQRTVKIHLHRVHGIKQQHICPICSREFKLSGNLKQHIATHSDHKRYICDWCGKRFHLPYNLKEHIHSHTGARPYQCTICLKSFGRNTLRQAHMRIHTGEKPYSCTVEECDRAYAYQTDLKRHKRSAHGIITKQFPCSVCSKIFYENKFLTKHMNVQHRS